MNSSYETVYRRSLEEPEAFWAEAAEAVHWDRKWDRVLDVSRGRFVHWFQGGRLNSCYNAVDRHVENGRADQAALIYDSPVTGVVRRISYRELQQEVSRFAGALRAAGLEKGDRLIIYMPMIPEAAVAMLACARIGVVHSVVFGGFASQELAIRIDDARPKAIVTASCGIEVQQVIPYKPLAGRGHRSCRAQAGGLRGLPEAAGSGLAPAGTRPGLGGNDGGGRSGGLPAPGSH